MKCPECKSSQTSKAGFAWRNKKKIQRYRCAGCGKLFSDKEKKETK